MRELGGKAKIDDTFPDEHVLAVSHDLIPWFTYFENYLARDIAHQACPSIRGKVSCII